MVTWAQAVHHHSWVRKARRQEKLHPTPNWRKRIHRRRNRRMVWRVLLAAGRTAAEIAEMHGYRKAQSP